MSAKIKYFLISFFLIITTSSHALDLRYGRGDFKINAGIAPLLSGNMKFNIDTWTLSQPHSNIGKSPVFYSVRFDYFESGFVNQITDFASLPLTTPFPATGQSIDDLIDQYTPVPVPADYRIHGTNLDISLGYDFIKNNQGFLGLGINTGLSLPFMKTRNLQSDANLVLDLLDTFETEIRTWKIGPVLHAGFKPTDGLSLRGLAAWNYQTGKLDNNFLGSGIQIDGDYLTLDLNAQLHLAEILQNTGWLNRWYVTGGYAYSKWDYDDTTVNILSNNISIPRVLDMDYSHTNFYLGLGYQF